MSAPAANEVDFDDLDHRHEEVLAQLHELERQVAAALEQFAPSGG
jgi:hypothetical protein